MSIPHLSEARFRDILAANFTPSEEIRTPERLFGRMKNLKAIDRALNSPGRQIFIYGDRGVGKTSLAVTAATVHTGSDGTPIYIPCGKESTFSSVMQAIGRSTTTVVERMEKPSSGRGITVGHPWIGNLSLSGGTAGSVTIPPPHTVDEALEVVKYVAAKRRGRLVVVIDEMERIASADERDKFAEFIKNIPTLENDIRFIFCGIASDITELLTAHPSAGRIIEAISLDKLRHDDLWQIIQAVTDEIHVSVDREKLIRISQISDGFPHFVHLIGDTMFWNVFDDPEPVASVGREHFRVGVTGALQRTEAILRHQYEKAVQKTKNTEDYEEVLWSMADTSGSKRQLSEIYEHSYLRIMRTRIGRKTLAKNIFNQRLLSLRKEGHGRSIVGYGAGWFSFRENILRGYVRLRAEEREVELGREIS